MRSGEDRTPLSHAKSGHTAGRGVVELTESMDYVDVDAKLSWRALWRVARDDDVLVRERPPVVDDIDIVPEGWFLKTWMIIR